MQLFVFKTIFYVMSIVGAIWLFAVGAILFSMGAFNLHVGESQSVANGAIYMSAFAMMLIINVAVIFPGILLLQPMRLWRVVRAEQEAITPRQRFRGEVFIKVDYQLSDCLFLAVYPRTYDPSFAIGCCVLAILLASAFSLIFPILSPAAVVLLFLTLIGTFTSLSLSS